MNSIPWFALLLVACTTAVVDIPPPPPEPEPVGVEASAPADTHYADLATELRLPPPQPMICPHVGALCNAADVPRTWCANSNQFFYCDVNNAPEPIWKFSDCQEGVPPCDDTFTCVGPRCQ